MRKTNLLVMSLFLAAAAGAADDNFLEKRSGYIEYDYLLPANAFKNMKDFARDEAAFYGGGATGSTKLTPGVGALRLGAYMGREGEDNLDLGASVGYVRGPESVMTVSQPDGTLLEKLRQRPTFVRIMFDGRATLPVSEGFKFRFRVGAGWAIGLMNGDLTTSLGTASSDDRWNGFAWEAGPSLAWTGKRHDVELHGVVMGFPNKVEDSLPSFSWTTWGAGISIHFKPRPEEEMNSF